MLKFVIGEKGSGKTEYCVNSASQKETPSVIIVPEQLSHRAESMLVKKLGVFGLGGIEILSFGQMARRARAVSENAVCRHIDNAGKVMVLYKIITENDDFALLKGNEEEKAVCIMKLISEFKRYSVFPEDIEKAAEDTEDKALSEKLGEIAIAYRKFEETLSGKFINSDDDLIFFASSSYGPEKYKGYNIFIDSFTSFTESEIKCIELFMNCAESVTVTLCMDFEKRGEMHFSNCFGTYEKLTRVAKQNGVEVEAPILMSRAEKRAEDMEFLAANYFNTGAKPFEAETNNIEIFTGKNLISEIEHTAATIRRLVMEEGYLYRDFAVLSSDMETYCEYIKTIFEKYEIKVFPDIKTNISTHPVAAFIISALEAITKGYTYSAVIRCIKYGFFDISDRECDILENFALESGARGGVWSTGEKWEAFVKGFFKKFYEIKDDENSRISGIIAIGKKVIEPLSALKEELGKSRLASDKCKAVYNFMVNIDVPKKLMRAAYYFEKNDDDYTAIEYKKVYNKIIDVLDEMCDATGDDKMSTAKFADILSVGIAQFEIGKIPALSDGVICGSIEKVKELDIPVLFILGMSEGSFPVSVNKTGFLNDYDRQRLLSKNISLAPDAVGKGLDGEYIIYRILTAPDKKLYLSHSMADVKGSALREAWALQKIKILMPQIVQKDDLISKDSYEALSAPVAAFENLLLNLSENEKQDEKYSAAYKWFKENPRWKERLSKAEKNFSLANKTVKVKEDVLDKLYGSSLTTAVTRLEKFSACPFSYYMRYVLSAEPRRVFSFQAKDAGLFLHSIMELFSKRLEASGKKWADVTDDYIKTEVREILKEDHKTFKTALGDDGKRGERFFVRLCAVAEFAIKTVTTHIQRGKFQPMGYEIKFAEDGSIAPLDINLPNGKKIRLTGVIDRLDAMKSGDDTYFRVIDYKSGKKEFDLGEIYNGITLQLAVYLCAAEKAVDKGKSAGMLYFRLINPEINTDPFVDDDTLGLSKIKKVSLSGLLVSSEDILDAMDTESKFDFLPVRKTKSGFSGSIASENSFKYLKKYVTKKVEALAKEIFSGRTDVSPYRTGDETPCTYCDYADACHFDTSLGCEYRWLETPGKDDIWDEIEKGAK